MDFGGDFSFLGISFQVCLIDLLLSGDNAVVIALACRSLPPEHMRKAVLYGTGLAILLRLLLTTVVGFLLAIPGLKLIGAVALIVIAIKLIIDEDADQDPDTITARQRRNDLLGAISVIFVADLVMSLDNVVALSAVAQGSIPVLAFGLLFSVPLLMYGSTMVTGLLGRYPLLISGGGALLGWLAGSIGVTDPLVVDWVGSSAPALTVAMPVLGALFVLVESKIVEADLKKVRPARVAAPRRVVAPKPVMIAAPVVEPAAPAASPLGDKLLDLFNRYPLRIVAGVAVLSWLIGGVLVPSQSFGGVPVLGFALTVVGIGIIFVFWGRARSQEEQVEAVAEVVAAPAPAPVEAPAAEPADLIGFLARLVGRWMSGGATPPQITLTQYRPPSRAEASAAGTLILIAEDDPADRAELQTALEWLGYAVEAAVDGQDALERLAEGRYGLLIADCYMPRLNGFKLATRLRQAEEVGGTRLPVVAFVAHFHAADGIEERYTEAGMDDCLGKPPTLQGIEQIVTRWLPAAALLRRPLAEPVTADTQNGEE